MIRTVDFAYAGARVQARYGRLVPASTWERLHRLETPAAFLQAARDTALRAWLTQIDPAAAPQQLDAQLRALFRRDVAQLAQWAPASWRPALAWVEVLPDLPGIAQRVRGGEDPPGNLAALRPAFEAKRPVAEVWLEHWRASWPDLMGAERDGLEQLVKLIRDALVAATTDAPAALARLQRPLRRLFRRNTRSPAGLFAWLALAWIEFAALRGALLRRRLGLPVEGAAA